MGGLFTASLAVGDCQDALDGDPFGPACCDVRMTHHVHILEMNGPSYRLAQSRSRKRPD